jgi:hypothetical protein
MAMLPEVTTIYVAGDAARLGWANWNEALAARCDHELICELAGAGCDTRGRYCLIGLDLHEVEQATSRAYRDASSVAEAVAA